MTAKACSYTRHETLKFPGTLSPVNKKYGTRFSGPIFFAFSAPTAGIQADLAQGFRNPAFRTGRGRGSARLKVFLRMKPGRISMQNYSSISLA